MKPILPEYTAGISRRRGVYIKGELSIATFKDIALFAVDHCFDEPTSSEYSFEASGMAIGIIRNRQERRLAAKPTLGTISLRAIDKVEINRNYFGKLNDGVARIEGLASGTFEEMRPYEKYQKLYRDIGTTAYFEIIHPAPAEQQAPSFSLSFALTEFE